MGLAIPGYWTMHAALSVYSLPTVQAASGSTCFARAQGQLTLLPERATRLYHVHVAS